MSDALPNLDAFHRLPTRFELRDLTEEIQQHHPGLELCGAQLYFRGPEGNVVVCVPWKECLEHQKQEGLLVQAFVPDPGDPGFFRVAE